MNLDDVKVFVTDHPKEIVIGIGGLVAGYVVFGRRSQATEGELSDGIDAPEFGSDGADGITPFPVTPTDPTNSSVVNPSVPIPVTIQTRSSGFVQKPIADLFVCPKGFVKRWGRDNMANSVVCRHKATNKDIPATRIEKKK